jgi:hypothetical protein
MHRRVFFSSELTYEPLHTSRDKCVYYNKTTNKIITSAYEGIPENLLLNFLGWMVGSSLSLDANNAYLPV